MSDNFKVLESSVSGILESVSVPETSSESVSVPETSSESVSVLETSSESVSVLETSSESDSVPETSSESVSVPETSSESVNVSVPSFTPFSTPNFNSLNFLKTILDPENEIKNNNEILESLMGGIFKNLGSFIEKSMKDKKDED